MVGDLQGQRKFIGIQFNAKLAKAFEMVLWNV